MPEAEVKVLYILGRGRGGSTILANVLGEIDGFFSAGEVRALWDPVVVSGGRCGCGELAERCKVWSQVIAGTDARAAARLGSQAVREHGLMGLLRRVNAREKSAAETFARLTGDVYRKLADTTGARVIVDSSKRPVYGAFLRSVPRLSVRYVHLVRDPRASAHSWKQRRYDSARPGAEVTRRGAFDSTLRWDVLNIEAELLRVSESPSTFLRLRHEDFVAQPRAVVARLVEFAGERADLSPFEDGSTVRIGPNHAIAGNPARFTTGRVQIRDTEEWRHGQSRVDRWTATAVSAPLLARYGYSLRVKADERVSP